MIAHIKEVVNQFAELKLLYKYLIILILVLNISIIVLVVRLTANLDDLFYQIYTIQVKLDIVEDDTIDVY